MVMGSRISEWETITTFHLIMYIIAYRQMKEHHSLYLQYVTEITVHHSPPRTKAAPVTIPGLEKRSPESILTKVSLKILQASTTQVLHTENRETSHKYSFQRIQS